MKYHEDLGFAKIYRNLPLNNKLVNIFKKSYNLNNKFFNKKPKKFKIYVCDNEEDFKKYSKPYYAKVTAVALGLKGITLKSPKFMAKSSRWKEKDFFNIVNHEMNHVFWYHICKTWSPQWFVEGLACYVGKNFNYSKRELKELVKKNKESYKILDFRYLRRNFKSGTLVMYSIWDAFLKFIIKNYSIKHIKKFICEFSLKPTLSNYKKIFKRIFGKSDRKLFNEFLKTFQ